MTPVGDPNAVDSPCDPNGDCWSVTATIVNGRYLKAPSRQATVTVRTSDVLVIFGNPTCKE